jgi:hypothetical protein
LISIIHSTPSAQILLFIDFFQHCFEVGLIKEPNLPIHIGDKEDHIIKERNDNMRKRNLWKKGITLSIILTMLVTLWPAGVFQVANAEVGDGNGYKDEMSYFILDSTTKTELGSETLDTELPNQFGNKGKTVFYRYGKSELPVSGSTVGIKTSESIYVKVERMIKDGDVWKVASNTGNNTLIYDPSNPRNFSGTVNLNDGMNRLTFTGSSSDGIGTKTDIMYVRYDSNIFLNSMTIIDGNESVPLEGVVPSASENDVITIEVKATNATRVILDGREYTPYGDDTFLVGPITIKQGLNTLNFELQNKEGTKQNYVREVYYYDPTTLFVDGEYKLNNGTTSNPFKDAFDATPKFPLVLTQTATGEFKGGMLVPYTGDATAQATDLQSKITLMTAGNFEATPTPTITVYDDSHSDFQLVRGPNGLDYAVFPVEVAFDYTPASANETASLTIESTYVSAADPSRRTFSFEVLDDSIIYIDNVAYDPSGSVSNISLSPTTSTKIAANDVETTTFVIDASKDISLETVTVNTPYGNATVTSEAVGSSNKQKIITVANLPDGEYNLTFEITNGGSPFDGRIRIDNTPMIVYKNFADGVTLDYTYIGPHTVEIELPNIKIGEDIGQSKFFVNDNEVFTFEAGQTVLDPANNSNNPYVLEYKDNTTLNAVMDGSGTGAIIGDVIGETDKTTINVTGIDLRRGTNTFEYTLFRDGRQISQRTISFFIDDDRTPEVTHYKPVLIEDRGPIGDPDSWEDSKGISYSKQTGNHTTNSMNYDMLLQAYEVNQFELTMNGTTILTYKDGETITNSVMVEGISRNVEDELITISGRQRLTVRIEGLDFNQSNIHTFYLKLVNTNGSMVTMPIEFRREVMPYLVKSPVPTNGKEIVVNRNYVPIYIQAENADKVIIDKEEAVYNKDMDWFEFTYIGLKANKWTDIDFTVVRGQDEIEGEVSVYYANTNQVGASFMQPFKNRIKALNGVVELDFPKGTVLRNRQFIDDRKTLYEGHNLLVGIADPENGLIDNVDYKGDSIPNYSGLRSRFSSLPNTFVTASPIIFVHGGLGVENDGQEPIVNGLQPHDNDYPFTHYLVDNRMLEPSQRGELTLTFDEGIRYTSNPLVTVFRLNQDGRWENIGGVVKKDEITVPFDDFGYYVAMKWRGAFEDASNHSWARNSIEAMYSKGYMNGKQLGVEFGTVDPVSRGEFAQLLVKALGLPINADGKETFIDVKRGYSGRSGSLAHEDDVWEYEYVETAARAGIVRGYSGNVFLPNKSLTREEAAQMLATALNLKFAKNDTKLREGLLKTFEDGDKISYYARPAVLAVHKAKIMEGARISTTTGDEKYNFYPDSTLTRAEAAVMITRVLINELKKLPKDFDTTNPGGQF